MLDVTAPQELQILETPPKTPRKLDHASINSLAYDLVTKVDLQLVCETYQLTMQQLDSELKTNLHLKQAVGAWKTNIQQNGAFTASIEAVASETLPYILQDNISPATDPTVRSRNMKMMMDYQTQQAKIRADQAKAEQGTGPTMGVQVNFNVSPGIRGISAPSATINQE